MNDLKAAVDILSALHEHNALLAPKGIAWADGRILVSKDSQEALYKSIPIALAALREQMNRSEGCEWCHEYIRMDNNYCAECGRDLAAPTAEHSSGVEETTVSKTEREGGHADEVY